MSLKHALIDKIAERGCATAEWLSVALGVSEYEVRCALKYAARIRLVHCIGRVEEDGPGQKPGIWALGPAPEKEPEPPRRLVSSVWSLAESV